MTHLHLGPSLSLSRHLSLSLSVSFSLSLCLSLSLSLSVSLSVSFSLFLSLSVSVCLSLSLSVSICGRHSCAQPRGPNSSETWSNCLISLNMFASWTHNVSQGGFCCTVTLKCHFSFSDPQLGLFSVNTFAIFTQSQFHITMPQDLNPM